MNYESYVDYHWYTLSGFDTEVSKLLVVKLMAVLLPIWSMLLYMEIVQSQLWYVSTRRINSSANYNLKSSNSLILWNLNNKYYINAASMTSLEQTLYWRPCARHGILELGKIFCDILRWELHTFFHQKAYNISSWNGHFALTTTKFAPTHLHWPWLSGHTGHPSTSTNRWSAFLGGMARCPWLLDWPTTHGDVDSAHPSQIDDSWSSCWQLIGCVHAGTGRKDYTLNFCFLSKSSLL